MGNKIKQIFRRPPSAAANHGAQHRGGRLDKWSQVLEAKTGSPEDALSTIQSGDKIFVGTACATPRTLIETLEASQGHLDDVQLCHFLTDGACPIDERLEHTRFHHKLFFVGTDCREMTRQGKAHYVPISISQLPRLIENRTIPIDVALIQVSPPDEHGYVSLGVSVDITLAAVLNAKKVIAELNPNMPYTYGESQIPLDRIDHIVNVYTPIIEYLHEPADEITSQIARYISRIIDDGSTLQIGLGQIPNEMLKHIDHKRNIGIHSDVITEPIIDLIEKGIITGNSKKIQRGKVVTSYCMGTRRLYEYVDRNPLFSFCPIDYVCDPAVITSNHKMVSVSQAFAIDLMGQVCADQYKGQFYGGVSSQPDFHRLAAYTPGGKSIVCMRATSDDGKESRIRSLLLEGEGVTIPRSDVHYIVTEYGVAYLFGKSIQERALALIEIAYPDFRQGLLEEAKRLGYVRQEQQVNSSRAYPVEEEKDVTLKDGQTVSIRPARASDVHGLQDLFYSLPPQDILTRFFAKISALPYKEAQHLCNVDYENEMAFVAVSGERENETIIGSCCYFVDHSENLGEVAYMIRHEWQSHGLGSLLQETMTAYARKMGLRGFKADILSENTKMIRLFQKVGTVDMKRDMDAYEMQIIF
jgi:acyl-CoA hydrolase/RimJ/RimL family protein N-acetyltransferase